MISSMNVSQLSPGQPVALPATLKGEAFNIPRSCEPSSISTAGVIHDLGNLIQVATSAIDIVSCTPEMPLARQKQLLARAKMSMAGAGALIRQTIGGIRNTSPTISEASVTACLADIAALIGIWDSGYSFAVDIDLPLIRCDPTELQSAVLNLVFNARTAVAGNGLITIAARTAQLDAVPSVEVSVTDNGIGMSPETIARVFEPFFTTKSDGLGGIGLPMVERFVRQVGGAITVESETGIGTTITMLLPATTSLDTDDILALKGENS